MMLKSNYSAAEVFVRQFDVIIRGFNGYNTDQAYAIFPKFMPTKSQAKVRLMVNRRALHCYNNES